MNNSLGNRRKFIKTTFAGGLGIGLTTPTILAKDLINAKETRIGIIGLDTSHSGAFTKYIHSLNNGFKVVAAYTTITKDIPSC
ncbi:MAG: gfo/Idh/MocA family oxidoreductase, partial [Cyclobacteriaceae bacterium]|nr:gfo/Idh/MocA family oxidoreductase [Cyclobacteriaceae bacterium]